MSADDITHRFSYHPPKNNDTVEKHERVRSELKNIAQWVDAYLPDGREKSLAITKLEEAMMWANAAIARG